MASFLSSNGITHFSDEKQNLLRDLLSSSTGSKQYRWFRISTEVLSPTVPFSIHQQLYKLCYAGYQDYESPAWFPNNYTITNGAEKHVITKTHPLHSRETNIQRIMRRKGFTSYSQFYDWSVGMDSCEEFWDTCIKELEVQFSTPYSRVLDYSAINPDDSVEDPHYGVKSVQYLKGARFNVADSCFPREFMAAEPGSSVPPAVLFASDSDPTLQTYSHLELSVFSAQVALALRRLPLSPGEAIGICMPMTPESIAIYLGIIRAGFAVVSIADSFSAIEIAMRMNLSNAKVIVTQDVIGESSCLFPVMLTRPLALPVCTCTPAPPLPCLHPPVLFCSVLSCPVLSYRV